jgi:transcription elongation GreA/GreB family factor
MDKSTLRQAIIDRLQADFDVLTRAAHMAREEATDEESKPKEEYETRAQEAAYLAESQAKLASELQATLALYKGMPMPDFSKTGQPADAGALVCLEAAEGAKRDVWYFLGARNGGVEVTVDNIPVTLVTPQSPLGRQLAGARVGDTVQLQTGRETPVPHRVAGIF